MLSLNSVKTRTIYSKQQIHSLYLEFKNKLNQAYEMQTHESINQLILIIKALFYLSDVPFLLKQLNEIGQVQLIAQLQVLFMKSSLWKSHKQVMQKWVATLMKRITKTVPAFNLKPQISSIQFNPLLEETEIIFYSKYIDKILTEKTQQSMIVSISFLRVFLIDQLQNKKRQFVLSENGALLPQWRSINENLIKVCHNLQNLKYEQNCVSISYWLCSQNKQFIQQCVLKGAVTFLCQTLSNKNISEWYGRKIINFLKLLLLGFEGKSQNLASADIQSSIAQFTLNNDSQPIMQQSRNLFSCLGKNDQKVKKLMQYYEKYQGQKNNKNLTNAVKNLRILFLHSQDEDIRKQLSSEENLEYFTKGINKEESTPILVQLFNLMAYNTGKAKQDQNDLLIIQKTSGLLQSAKDKNELILNNKKMLITLLRMLRKLLENRQYSEKLVARIKSENLLKKFTKFSDFSNFKYERELLSFTRALNFLNKNNQKQSQSNDFMRALVKFISENTHKRGKRIEDQLEELELIYEMIDKGEFSEISQQMVQKILKKLKTNKHQTEEIQISILDRAEEQGNRQLANRINYLALSCLQKLQNKTEKADKVELNSQNIETIVNIGLTTDDVEILKVETALLIGLLEHQKIPENSIEQVGQIYRRYRQILGEDCQLELRLEKRKQKGEQEAKQKYLEKLVSQSLIQSLQQEKYKQIEQQILNQQHKFTIERWLQLFKGLKVGCPQSTLIIFLKFLFKLSQVPEYKREVFLKYSSFLDQILEPSSSSCITSLIFKIFSELFQQSINGNQPFFNKILTKSYEFLERDSVQFTSNSLRLLKYNGSESRKQQYWKYIYNSTDMIGRQALYLLKDEDSQKIQNFWSFFSNPIYKNVQQEKKLTLHFLQIAGLHINRQSWIKFQLNLIFEQIMQLLNQRNMDLHTRTPSQVLLRKLLRLIKPIKSVVKNQSLDISNQLLNILSNVAKFASSFPKIITDSAKIISLGLQYLSNLLYIIMHVCYRREYYTAIKGECHLIYKTIPNILSFNDENLNDTLMEIFRVLYLRDNHHQSFSEMKQTWMQKGIGEISKISEKGVEHQKSCKRIIDFIEKKNQVNLKKQFLTYFFPDGSKKGVNIGQSLFTDEELLRHLKNLLSPPYQYGLNFLQKCLRLVQSPDFANILIRVFVNSQRLYQQDLQNKVKSLQDIQKSIANCIWGLGSKINEDFYKMIDMNLIGLEVCLRTKGIGVEGTRIVCQKFFQYPEHIPLCADILNLNVLTSKQWNVLVEKKIYEIIVSKYQKNGKDQKYGLSLANLVGSSSKLKTLQSQYRIQKELYENLQYFKKNQNCIAATLYAISGLVYLNDLNQQSLGKKQQINYYLKIMEENKGNYLVFQRGCNLLSNIVYKNTMLISAYIQLSVHSIVVNIATCYLYEYNSFKQFLRLIGNLSLSPNAAHAIIKTQFLYLWINIVRQADNSKHEDIIKYSFDIIFNLLNFNEIQTKVIAYKIHQVNCLPSLIQFLQKNSLITSVVESGLDALQKLFILQVIRNQAIQKGVLKCLQDIAKTQSWSQSILEKWIKVLYALTKDQEIIKNSLLHSQIFTRMATFIKQHQQIKQQYLDTIVQISNLVYLKGDPLLFSNSGFIDLLSELLKIKYLKSVNAYVIIDYFNHLHSKKCLTSSSYTKIFSGLVSRLQIQFRQQNSKRIISTITKIRDHIVINTRAAGILLQFAYIFLTQREIITSQKYHKRVRQFICLLSYFISFSLQLKIIFRQEGFIQILKSWIKIDNSLEQDNSIAEACRVCIFTIQNEQKFLVNIIDASPDLHRMAINKLLNGSKCFLYRRDHSNKDAILKVREKDSHIEVIAFKAPNGQIKPKYILPLVYIVGLRAYEKSEDHLFSESVFSSPKGLFQNNAIPENCLTLIGIVGDELSIRQIDVQFLSYQYREQFMTDLKLLASLQLKQKQKQLI